MRAPQKDKDMRLSQFPLATTKETPADAEVASHKLLLRAGYAEKPSLAAYRLPIWLPRPRIQRGRRVRVWGLLRPAAAGQPATATIDYRPARSKTWAPLRTVTVTSRRHYLWTTAKVPRSGHLRISFAGHTSRAAYVRVR